MSLCCSLYLTTTLSARLSVFLSFIISIRSFFITQYIILVSPAPSNSNSTYIHKSSFLLCRLHSSFILFVFSCFVLSFPFLSNCTVCASTYQYCPMVSYPVLHMLTTVYKFVCLVDSCLFSAKASTGDNKFESLDRLQLYFVCPFSLLMQAFLHFPHCNLPLVYAWVMFVCAPCFGLHFPFLFLHPTYRFRSLSFSSSVVGIVEMNIISATCKSFFTWNHNGEVFNTDILADRSNLPQTVQSQYLPRE